MIRARDEPQAGRDDAADPRLWAGRGGHLRLELAFESRVEEASA